METLLGILCLLVFLGIAAWAVDLVLFAPVRAYRRLRDDRWQSDLERERSEQAMRAAIEDVRDKVEDATRAEEILRRATGQAPELDPPPAPSRPTLRVIHGGPNSEPPEAAPEEEHPEPEPPIANRPSLPEGGPPFPGGRYQVNLGPPDGPSLTVWQRNYIRYLFNRARCTPEGLDMKEMTTRQAENLVTMLGGSPRKLYSGGRAWGQKRR